MSEDDTRGTSNSVPRAEATEAHVLGYVILKGLVAWKELVRISGKDDLLGLFYNSNHRAIARAILRLVEEERSLTEGSIDDQLTAQKATLSGDNRDVIVSLMSSTGIDTKKVFNDEVKQLVQYRIKRGILQSVEDLRTRLSDDAITVSDASQEIKTLGVSSTTIRELPTFGEIIHEMETSEAAPWHVSTGMKEFDDALGGGFTPGSNIVIGARPKMGKTTLLNNFCINALDNDTVVFFASLEMLRPQIYSALMSCYGSIDRNITNAFAEGRESLRKIRSNHGDEVASDIEEARDFLMDSDLKVAFPEHMQGDAITAIESHIASTVANYEGRRVVAFIDYLQLMSSSPFRLREEVTGITRRLKMLAMELNIPIVYLSQLNREGDDGSMPRASNLRDSGSIEQDADAVVMLNRKSFYDPQEPEHIMDVSIPLNRRGPQTQFQLYWKGILNLIDSLDGETVDDMSEDFE